MQIIDSCKFMKGQTFKAPIFTSIHYCNIDRKLFAKKDFPALLKDLNVEESAMSRSRRIARADKVWQALFYEWKQSFETCRLGEQHLLQWRENKTSQCNSNNAMKGYRNVTYKIRFFSKYTSRDPLDGHTFVFSRDKFIFPHRRPNQI